VEGRRRTIAAQGAVKTRHGAVALRAPLKVRHGAVATNDNSKEEEAMYLALQPLIALIAGILILVAPRLLKYIVAVYLIVVGVLGLVRGL